MLRTAIACLVAMIFGLALGATLADDVRTDRGDNQREIPITEPKVRISFVQDPDAVTFAGAPVVMRPVQEGPSIEQALETRAFSPTPRYEPIIEPAGPPSPAPQSDIEQHLPLAPTLEPEPPETPPEPILRPGQASEAPLQLPFFQKVMLAAATAPLTTVAEAAPEPASPSIDVAIDVAQPVPDPEPETAPVIAASVVEPAPLPISEPETVAVAAPAPEPIAEPAPAKEEVTLVQSPPAPAVEGASAPAIALVIDDLGFSDSAAQRVVALPVPITVAILPYGRNLDLIAQSARAEGHGVMLHLPMEPDGNEDPGPIPLLTGLSDDQLRTRIEWNFTRFDGFDGVNNHMGSRFTRDAHALRLVLEEVQRRGLFFMDSVTSPRSVGVPLAHEMRLPVLKRDVFLDDVQSFSQVSARLASLEPLARQQGYAVAIGHPHDVTLDAIEKWIPRAQAKGFRFVTTKELLRQMNSAQLASLPATGG